MTRQIWNTARVISKEHPLRRDRKIYAGANTQIGSGNQTGNIVVMFQILKNNASPAIRNHFGWAMLAQNR